MGADVVVDYAFWSRAQREEYRALGRLHGAEVSVVYLDTSEGVLRRRLAARQGVHSDDLVVDSDLLDRFVTDFEPPEPDEDDVTVISMSG